MSNKYQKVIEELDPSIRMLLDRVRRYLSAGKASVMVGCGFSKNADNDGTGRMKEWNALNIDLYKSLYGKEPSREELCSLNPIRLAAQVESAHSPKELDDIIANALPDKSVTPGSLHKKLMKLNWHDVFTTNYDTLLERSCDESGIAYTLVTNKDTLLYSQSPRIIKLHGSFPDMRPFIMSEEAFRTYPQKYPEFVNTVKQSLIENLFCLIGFSGDDPNFLSWYGWMRDVMGSKMTNAVLVGFNKKGIHLSEKQLFSKRKIDILNLAEIKDLGTYSEALDFFLTYIGTKEESVGWEAPSIRLRLTKKQKEEEIAPDDFIKGLEQSHDSYPGWVFVNESTQLSIGIRDFPFLGNYYNKLPDELKIRYLYEIDWLLDICLYPKYTEWYITALTDVMSKYAEYKGEDRVKSRQLIVSLLSIYREKRMIDEYLKVLSFINKNLKEDLTTRQLSIFYYEQCLWNLSILDYKEVYVLLSKWKIEGNDFIGALWQTAVYNELGEFKTANDIVLTNYSRLTTRMLTNGTSDYLTSCKQLYSFVISRTIRRNLLDIDFSDDRIVEGMIRGFIKKSDEEQPKVTQSHGFNVGQVTRHTHAYQGGFKDDYLYSEKYLKLSYLHGNTFHQNNSTELHEYEVALQHISCYHFYEAISYIIRSGQNKLVNSIINRETLSRIDSETIYLVFTDLLEMLKEYIQDANKRVRFVTTEVLVPILQRLCTKVDDNSLMEFFEFVIQNASNALIKRDDILRTIYASATGEQKKEMFCRVMEHHISLDDHFNDILLPDDRPEIKVSSKMYEECTKNISNKHYGRQSYYRILMLLECKIDQESREKLENCIVEWRKKEKKDANAFFSYHVVSAKTEEDKAIEKRWIDNTINSFIDGDYSDLNNSQSIMDFAHSVDSTIPALDCITNEKLNDVIDKIISTIEGFLPRLKEDDSDDLMGGMRHFSSYMFNVLDRVFCCIDFNKVEEEKRRHLAEVLLKYFEAEHPCFAHYCMVDNTIEKTELAKMAASRIYSKDKNVRRDSLFSLFRLFKAYPETFTPADVFEYVKRISYFMEYSHSRNLNEYICFVTELIADGYLDKNSYDVFCSALLTMSNEYRNYEMPYEYKIDIAREASVLAGVISTKIDKPNAGVNAWKVISEDKEEFRDVRIGFAEGVAKGVKQGA